MTVSYYTPVVSSLVNFTGTPAARGRYDSTGEVIVCAGQIRGLQTNALGNLSLKVDMPGSPDEGALIVEGLVKANFISVLGTADGIISTLDTVPANKLMTLDFPSVLSLGADVIIIYSFSYKWQA